MKRAPKPESMNPTSQRLRPFGTTVFAEMTGLAIAHKAINLAQGFPDFEGPPEIIEAAVDALRSGHNQYARSMGVPQLVEAIAHHQKEQYGIDLDAMREVTVFCGATEGIAATVLGTLNPGDEVILLEPFYDSYPATVALAGGVPRFCTLRFPDFRVDEEALRACFTDRTRLLILNSPHNPTGKVFTREELVLIAALCVERDVLVLADEVYEHLVFDDAQHIPIATLPGMWERTVTVSSLGKTWSFTGWKVGWATAPAPLLAAVQSAHQFLTYAGAAPLQHAAAAALREHRGDYLVALRHAYTERRDFLARTLQTAGFRVAMPRGTYFILADFSALHAGDDRSFVRRLIEETGVAAIPPSVFYHQDPAAGRSLLRFAFCKEMRTLQQAAERLKKLR